MNYPENVNNNQRKTSLFSIFKIILINSNFAFNQNFDFNFKF